MTRGSRKRLNETALTLPSAGWLLAFFLLPTLFVAVIAFKPYDFSATMGIGQGWTFDSIRSVIDRDYPKIVWRTAWISVATTATCILLGIPMAYYMARVSARTRSTVLMLTVVPFWTSFIIRIFAWMQVLHTDGALKQFLVVLGLMAPDGALMYNMRAVLLVMAYTSLPFAILPLYAAAEKFDFQLMDAAMDLGATKFQAVRSTFIPGIRSGILFATLMVLVPNLGCYVASEVIGGTDCMLLGNRIKECAVDFRNLPYACALSLFLMLGIGLSLALLLGLIRWRGGRGAVAAMAERAGEAVG
jgi:spermidine/putrescine transport system permease protein